MGGGITDSGEIGENLSSPNRASCVNGLETLLGGDPQKKGGDEAAACVHVCSDEPYPPPCNGKIDVNIWIFVFQNSDATITIHKAITFAKMRSKSSGPALDS